MTGDHYFRDWLICIGLTQYIDLFESQGYTTMHELQKVTWEDLEDIGINKLGHMKRICLALKKLKAHLFHQSATLFYMNTSGNMVLIERKMVAIPTEILVSVFRMFDVASKMKLDIICRRWQDIALNHIWTNFDILVPSANLSSPKFETFSSELDCAKACRMWFAKEGSKKLCSLMKKCYLYLKFVDLNCLYIDYRQCWQLVLNKIPVNQLLYINMSSICMNSNQLSQVCRRFKTLKGASFSHSLFKVKLTSFFLSCTLLERLDLSHNDLANTSLEYLPSALIKLILYQCDNINYKMLLQIGSKCHKMEHLDLELDNMDENNDIPSNFLFNVLSELKSLKTLDFGVRLQVPFTSFPCLEELYHLKLEFDSFLTDALFQDISRCIALKRLILIEDDINGQHYSEQGLRHLANLQKLTELHLDGIWHVTKSTLIAIAHNNDKINVKFFNLPSFQQV